MPSPESPTVSNPASPGWSRSIERLRTATAGRFTILRELGRGGFATVFLAQQHKPNRRVAIKLLSPALLDSDWALEHFRGESQKIAEWRHQAVVTIYEVHEEDALLYFVMSYVEGASLYELLQLLGPLPISIVRSVLAQVGSALNYAHRQGVTHRDVKPHNILVDVDGGAVVTDFGIAKQMDGTSHTVTGMIVGTAPYMAPEQCESGKTTVASDQYALGIVAYEMLVGTPPFTGAPMAVLMAHLQQPIPSIRERRPDCPPELEAAVLRMLAKKPAERFGSVAEAMHAAGAQELSDAHPDRRWFAEAARRLAARQQAPVLDIVSMPPAIEVGERIPIGAQARTTAGEPLADVPVEWSSGAEGLVRLDVAEGTLTGVQPGRTTVVVRGGGVEQEIQLEVRPPQPAVVVVQGPERQLRVGELGRLSATVTSHHGATVQALVHWQSAQPQLATIGPDGVLRAHAAGRVHVIASAGQANGELWVDIAPPRVDAVRITGDSAPLLVDEHRPLSALALDEHGQPLADRVIHWSSSDRERALVSATGRVTGCAAGTVTITASCEERTATLRLMVREPPVTAVELAGPSSGLQIGDRIRAHATVRAPDGRALARDVEWTSEDPSIAVVSADGTVTAVGPGVATIAATCEGVRSTMRLTVVPAAPVFSPAPLPVPVPAPAHVPAPVPALAPTSTPASGPADARAGDSTTEAARTAAAETSGDTPADDTPAGVAAAGVAVAGVTAWIAPPHSHAPPSPPAATAEPVTTSPAVPADGSDAEARAGRMAGLPVPSAGPARRAEAGTATAAAGRRGSRTRTRYVAAGVAVLGVGALVMVMQGGNSADMATSGGSSPRPDTMAASIAAGGSPSAGPPASPSSPAAVVPPSVTAEAPPVATAPIDGRGPEPGRSADAVASPLLVRSAAASLRVGDSLVMRATRDGQPVGSVAWRSTNRAVATVSAGGVVRAIADGRVGIVGTAGGSADTALLTVQPRPPEAQVAAIRPTVPATPAGGASPPPPLVLPPKAPANPAASGNPVAGAAGAAAVNPPPAPPAAAAVAAAAEDQLRHLVESYASAVRARSLDRVLQLYPAMSQRERDGWRSFFDFARDLQVALRVESLDVKEATAMARVSGEYRYTNPATRRPCQQPLTMQMHFTHPGAAWQITAIEQQQGRGSGC